MKTKILILFLALAPVMTQAQVNYAVSGNTAYVTNSPAIGDVVIANTYDGYPVTSIGDNAFADTGLTSVTIPNSVTNIGEWAFYYCDGLTNVTIGNSVTSLGAFAFGYCFSLTSVTIPNSVTSLGDSAFEYCSSLTSVTIPNSVTSIGEDAFLDCSGLTGVTIGNSVTNIDAFAFNECSGLTNIAVSASNPDYSSTNGVLFDKDQATLIQFPAGLGGVYTIPNSVTSIGDLAFLRCSGLTSVTIPDSVTSIGDLAFIQCSGLTSVTIPNSVTSIGEDTFASCSNLMSVTIPNSVTNIGDEAFEYCPGLTNVTIGNSVTSIGDEAFWNCSGLTSVTIGNSVTNIGDQAFAGCGLTSVTIPNSVTSIGGGAFEETGLTGVTIPANVTNIGEYAFGYCSGLTNITFSGNAPLVDGAAGSADSTVFQDETGTVYYYAGTSGWGSTYGGLPTVELDAPPQIGGGGGIGIQSGSFGFTITGVSNQTVVVEASTNLLNWQVIQTITLSGASTNFTDPQWTNFPTRFYRAVGAFTVGGTLAGPLGGGTVTLQDNGGDDLTLSADGTFTFPTALPDGQSYSVTVSGTSASPGMESTGVVTANGSGTISGANVTNVAVFCHTAQVFTGDLDVDMYNAAVADGTAHGGVPGVMLTQNGGPYRVTAGGFFSNEVCREYSTECVFTLIVGTGSCSSTTLPNGGNCIQFGNELECGFGPYQY